MSSVCTLKTDIVITILKRWFRKAKNLQPSFMKGGGCPMQCHRTSLMIEFMRLHQIVLKCPKVYATDEHNHI